ncbi:MAG: hypothetical protein MUF49_15770 [Oculatellaceae cyanobacterium Prado106]|jgi:hypothetical protein|nr:hypothetical protein [Oculatellaceae cyanobacterium Prado106]
MLDLPVLDSSPSSDKKHLKLTEINYRRNTESDYTERMEALDRAFDYERDRHHVWGEPELSLLYGTPLYEQASESQKLALNHLYWATQYNQTAATEANTVLYNQVTTGVFAAMGGYDTLCKELDLETEQERHHIHAFHTIGYKTKKALLGQAGFTATIASKNKPSQTRQRTSKGTAKTQPKYVASKGQESPLPDFQDKALRFATRQIFLKEQSLYYSQYLQQLESKGEEIPAQTTGLVGQLGSRPLLKFFTLNCGSSPFLASVFYVARFMANMLLKNYEYRYFQCHRNLERQGEFIPAPVAVSYYHLLDESFHTTTSQTIAQDLYKDFAKPTAYERWVANLIIYQAQRVALSGLSASLPGIFRSDDAFILPLYRLLQSPVFNFSPSESLHWLEQSLCQEHEGFQVNLKYHDRLLTNLQQMFTDIDYLWGVNREMRLMVKGGAIAPVLEQNRKALRQFAASVSLD